MLNRLASSSILLGLLAGASVASSACGTTDAGDVEDGVNDTIDGKADSSFDPTTATAPILALVNDTNVDDTELDVDAGLSSRVATNIVAHRNGPDGMSGTSDDKPYSSLADLDAVPYVGPATMKALLKYALDHGYGSASNGFAIDVLFSPQPAATASTVRIAQMIRDAKTSIDIAIYSYSDAGIAAALTDAIARGVKVRFLYDPASTDKSLADATAKASSGSGKIESSGVNVRWVNKILHDKIIIVDGPRDDASLAATTKIAMGSSNWTYTGGQEFDENTMFFSGSTELAEAYQRDFDLLWAHSGDFSLATMMPWVLSTTSFPTIPDDPGVEAFFTTANFKAPSTGTTFRVVKGSTVVADQLVAAINRASKSIHIASTHLRLRSVALALIARHQADPSLDIEVYLDQQEFVSVSGDAAQKKIVSTCLTKAGTDAAAQADCTANDYLYSKMVVDAGIPLHFKSYAYHWDASFANQMHSKYVIIDGDELFSGSYNLSMNSEQGTFENVLHLTGASNLPTITKFENNFASIFGAGRNTTTLADLQNTIKTSATIPLAFPPMALTWQEFTDLRALLRANCKAADSPAFREMPAAHKTCTR